MDCQQLIANINDLVITVGDASKQVNGITCQINQCQAGWVYAAFTNNMADSKILNGRDEIPEAVTKGIHVILTDLDGFLQHPFFRNITYLIHANPQEVFAKIKKEYFR